MAQVLTMVDPTEFLKAEIDLYRDAVALVNSYNLSTEKERVEARAVLLAGYESFDDFRELFWAMAIVAYTIASEHGNETIFSAYFNRINKHERMITAYLSELELPEDEEEADDW